MLLNRRLTVLRIYVFQRKFECDVFFKDFLKCLSKLEKKKFLEKFIAFYFLLLLNRSRADLWIINMMNILRKGNSYSWRTLTDMELHVHCTMYIFRTMYLKHKTLYLYLRTKTSEDVKHTFAWTIERNLFRTINKKVPNVFYYHLG